MYSINPKKWGIHLTFAGTMDAEEMTEWKEASQSYLADTDDEFGVFVDMRNLRVLDDEAKEMMMRGQEDYREAGMVRSVVILSSTLLTMQFRSIAKDSGIYEYERYLDATQYDDWNEIQRVGLDWVVNGIDPDADTDDPTEDPLPMSEYSAAVATVDEDESFSAGGSSTATGDGGVTPGEQSAAMRARMDEVESKVDRLEERMEDILAGVNKALGQMEQSEYELRSDLGQLREDLATVEELREDLRSVEHETERATETAEEAERKADDALDEAESAREEAEGWI